MTAGHCEASRGTRSAKNPCKIVDETQTHVMLLMPAKVAKASNAKAKASEEQRG